jgi:peptide deformylase
VAVLPILTIEDPRLRQKAKKVRRVDASIERLIDDMVETMHHANGVGLAAVQVGVPLRVAVIQLPPEEQEDGSTIEHDLIVLINPEFVKQEGEREVEEGCLSLPGYRGSLTRFERVTVKAKDRQGKSFRVKAEGLLAQALEHELDHLNGVIYIDRMDDLDKLVKVEPKDDEETGKESEEAELVPVEVDSGEVRRS